MRHRLRRAAVPFVALVASLGAWELALRATVVRPISYHHDPGLGWMPEPHAVGLHAEEGRAECRYNASGFRGPEITPRRAGELRVACLGDSFTEGQQVSEDETFAARLGAVLAAGPNPSARVWNGGRGATSPAYLVGLSDAYLRAFDPDVVVALVRDASWDAALARERSEVSYRVEGGSVEVETSFRWLRLSPLHRLYLASPAARTALGKRAASRASELRRATRAQATATAGELTREREMAITFTLVELARRYPQVVVVHVPDPRPTHDGLSPPSALEERLARGAAESGLAFVATRAALESEIAAGVIPFGFANTLPWSGHPNAEGHRIIASAIARHFAGPGLGLTPLPHSPGHRGKSQSDLHAFSPDPTPMKIR